MAKVRKGGLCSECAKRKSCQVEDDELTIWVRSGQGCRAWKQEKPGPYSV